MRKYTRKMLITTIIIIIYVILKVYVLNTSTSQDDAVPDLILHLVQT